MIVEGSGWLRWINVALRGLHLAAVILLGANLLGAPVSSALAVPAVILTGLAMFVVDILKKPSHLREVAGIAVLVKLVLVAWMASDSAMRPALFWLIVGGSAVFAHAPARFRHTVLFGPPKPPKD